MKRCTIAVAFGCAVFFAPSGAIPQTDEEQIAAIPPEWYAPDDCWPDGYQPWDHVPHFSPNDPASGCEGAGSEPVSSGVGVPEPGSAVLLISSGLCLFAWAWRRARRS